MVKIRYVRNKPDGNAHLSIVVLITLVQGWFGKCNISAKHDGNAAGERRPGFMTQTDVKKYY